MPRIEVLTTETIFTEPRGFTRHTLFQAVEEYVYLDIFCITVVSRVHLI
jgi:hypothetical protein